MTAVLVINSGSSSLKYQLLDPVRETVLASGLIERIGAPGGILHHRNDGDEFDLRQDVVDHRDAFRLMIDAFAEHGPDLVQARIGAIGHRVVQGGSLFDSAVVIDDEVRRRIRELSELAPLHNPANLAGIEAAGDAFPGVPQVAVFDTAFHQTLSPSAYTYALDRHVAERFRVRRYGFHGTSHKYVSECAARVLGRPLAQLRTIVLHLGNGASACAVDAGRSVDTSMGMTPLEGLVMGTRTGDLDPAVLLHLGHAGYDFDGLDELLNRKSGLLGLAGSGDMRDVQKAAANGDRAAEIAIQVYCRRITHYVGAYHALLGGADAIVFTAGVGENNADVRRRSLAGLERLGIVLDPRRNAEAAPGPRVISADESAVSVLVIPTNEELEIARQAVGLVAPREP